jgi:hypothetical protein
VFHSQAKNYQRVDAPTTTTLAGETWSQGAATGDITPSNQTSSVAAKVIVIATNYPSNSSETRGLTIAYGTDQRLFDLLNKTYFQPMLTSFTFVSK